jgi:hypothetical protein
MAISLRADVFDPNALAETLRGLIGRYHGVAIVALDHPLSAMQSTRWSSPVSAW